MKAHSVDKGDGFWGKNRGLCDAVRKIYLNLTEVTYFLVCVDKRAHRNHYLQPKDPATLSLQFLLERLQRFCQENNQTGYIVIDLNKRVDGEQRDLLSRLLRWGSGGTAVSKFYGEIYEWRLEMSNIVEIHFGDSKYSLGLQIADFVARHAYSWRKKNKDPKYPGWSYIEPRLYKYRAHLGRGYKELP